MKGVPEKLGNRPTCCDCRSFLLKLCQQAYAPQIDVLQRQVAAEERSSKQARRGADVAATAPRTSSTDKQLATLKERYTQLKGSTPRGPYSNNPDWLRTKIAEMASSAPAQTTAAAPAAGTAGTAAAAQTEKSARAAHEAPQPVAPAAVASAGKRGAKVASAASLGHDAASTDNVYRRQYTSPGRSGRGARARSQPISVEQDAVHPKTQTQTQTQTQTEPQTEKSTSTVNKVAQPIHSAVVAPAGEKLEARQPPEEIAQAKKQVEQVATNKVADAPIASTASAQPDPKQQRISELRLRYLQLRGSSPRGSVASNIEWLERKIREAEQPQPPPPPQPQPPPPPPPPPPLPQQPEPTNASHTRAEEGPPAPEEPHDATSSGAGAAPSAPGEADEASPVYGVAGARGTGVPAVTELTGIAPILGPSVKRARVVPQRFADEVCCDPYGCVP
jgi:hypothetical protein